MRLHVRPLRRKQGGSGLASIDRHAMVELGVSSGEFVTIHGSDGRAVARVWPGRREDSGSGVVVIAATNRPDLIDSALLRPGRLDRHVAVDEPDADARREILTIHARDRPLADDVDLDDIADRTDGYVGAALEAVCREAATVAVREYVRAVAAGEDRDPDEIVLTADHFERASRPSSPAAITSTTATGSPCRFPSPTAVVPA